MTRSIFTPMRAFHLRRAALALAGSLALTGAAAAQGASVSEELIAKAKQEGQLVYYTDLIVDQVVRPLVAAFDAKYGIKVNYSRGDSQDNVLKILNEYRAGRVQADVFGLTSGLQVLVDAGAFPPVELHMDPRAALS